MVPVAVTEGVGAAGGVVCGGWADGWASGGPVVAGAAATVAGADVAGAAIGRGSFARLTTTATANPITATTAVAARATRPRRGSVRGKPLCASNAAGCGPASCPAVTRSHRTAGTNANGATAYADSSAAG